MSANTKKKVYVSPKIEMHEMEAVSIISASIDPRYDSFGTEEMDKTDWSDGNVGDYSGSYSNSNGSGTESMNKKDWSSYGWN